ncbi:MAG: class I SAM-dependent methyltransferase [Solirubrobacteraceae bacterium]
MTDPRAVARRLRRKLSRQETVWERGLATEVDFWAEWIATRGLQWPEEFERRFDPGEPLRESLVLDVLDRIAAGDVRILDVGAGPATSLGKTHPAKRLLIEAVDPLGDDYAHLLAEAGAQAPVRTQPVAGEELTRAFEPASFDIAYARNALDHSIDPARIIREMLAVVRPGGFVLLRHYENEAETMRYEELHQWNFCLSDGRLVVWNDRRRIDVAAELAGEAAVAAAVEGGSGHAAWVTAVIERQT